MQIFLYSLTNVLGEATYDEIPSENVTYEQWLKVCALFLECDILVSNNGVDI